MRTDEQVLGPEVQRAALKRWCVAHGGRLLRAFIDHGVSGGESPRERPGLLATLSANRDLRAGVLLVAKRDRLARDTLLAAAIERLVERDGAAVRSADGLGDGDAPEAVLMRRIVDAFAEYERLVIRARTRAALAVKRARGERVSHEPRYGWRVAGDGLHLEVDPREQRIVALTRRYRSRGLALRQIGKRLAEAGFRPRSGGRWHPQTIATMAATEVCLFVIPAIFKRESTPHPSWMPA